MPKYMVKYEGFAYVEADSPEEAQELFENDEFDYLEQSVGEVKEVDEFVVHI